MNSNNRFEKGGGLGAKPTPLFDQERLRNRNMYALQLTNIYYVSRGRCRTGFTRANRVLRSKPKADHPFFGEEKSANNV